MLLWSSMTRVSLGNPGTEIGVLEALLETGDGLGGGPLESRDEGGQLPPGLLEIGGLENP